MKKRILFVNGHMNVGGVEKSLLDLLRHLDYGKYDVDLLLLEDLGDYIPEIPPEVNIVFKDLTNTYGSFANSFKRCLMERDVVCLLMRLIFVVEKTVGRRALVLARKLLFGRARYDVAIGYRTGICSDLVAHAVNAKKKATWWHHGEINLKGPQLSAYIESCDHMDHVIAVSEGCAHMLENAVPELEGRVAVIPNMVDIAEVKAKAALFNPYKEKDGFRLVTVGRLSSEKKVENVVYAADFLVQQGLSNFHWHIIGEGPEREKIETLIRNKHLEHVISLEGSQPNPYPYMKHATLYVHTSYVESQGLTILEAMALGVPCVVTRSIGPEGYIREGENGVLVEQNVESLVEAILKVIQSPQHFKTLQENTCCPAEFSCENIMRKVDQVINFQLEIEQV